MRISIHIEYQFLEFDSLLVVVIEFGLFNIPARVHVKVELSPLSPTTPAQRLITPTSLVLAQVGRDVLRSLEFVCLVGRRGLLRLATALREILESRDSIRLLLLHELKLLVLL
jgi:hypothetical protein